MYAQRVFPYVFHAESYQCVHCFKNFYNEELLNTHMYFHINKHKCSMCDMTCPSPSALAKHIRQRHIAVKPFQCRSCAFQTALKKDLERHIMTQHEQHVYACEEFDCDFETPSYYMMRMVRFWFGVFRSPIRSIDVWLLTIDFRIRSTSSASTLASVRRSTRATAVRSASGAATICPTI